MTSRLEATGSAAGSTPVPPAPAPRPSTAAAAHPTTARAHHETEPLPALPAAVQQTRLNPPPAPPVMSGEQMRAILDLVL